MKKLYLIIGIFILIVISVLGYYFTMPIKNFTVEFSEKFSSSGGDRTIFLNYIVENGTVISCDKVLKITTLNDSVGIKNSETCDLFELLDDKYPKVYYKFQSKQKMVNYGRGSYSYIIILN